MELSGAQVQTLATATGYYPEFILLSVKGAGVVWWSVLWSDNLEAVGSRPGCVNKNICRKTIVKLLTVVNPAEESS